MVSKHPISRVFTVSTVSPESPLMGLSGAVFRRESRSFHFFTTFTTCPLSFSKLNVEFLPETFSAATSDSASSMLAWTQELMTLFSLIWIVVIFIVRLSYTIETEAQA